MGEHGLKTQLELTWQVADTDDCGGPEPGMEMASCCSCLVKSLQCPLLTKCDMPPAGRGEVFTGSSTRMKSRAKKGGFEAEG